VGEKDKEGALASGDNEAKNGARIREEGVREERDSEHPEERADQGAKRAEHNL
jgi:hypothetical protein